MRIENPAFCLFLYLMGVHFRGEQKIKCPPIRTPEIRGVTLSDVLYVLQLLKNLFKIG